MQLLIKIIKILLITGLTFIAMGSNGIEIQNSKNFIVLKADAKNMYTKVEAPIILKKGNNAAATFIVNYNGFSSQARTAFQYAVDIWASILTSNVPIRVEANWVALDPNVLGSASAATFYRDYTNTPRSNTWYSVSMAEKLAGIELNPVDSSDIKANFNSSFSNWYFGTDGNCPPGQYDFVSVVLHELCHGLGFQGSMDVNSGSGSWGFSTGFPFVYDHFTEDGSGQRLINTSIYANPSSALGNVLVSNNIFFNGNVSCSVNGYNPIKLFSPPQWEPTSSYSHLNESTFPAGNINSLMTPSLGAAEAIHHPGNITLGIFEDMGWTTNLVTNTTMVHPGDTDNNGTVNAMDILPIGVYFLLQGGSRQEISFTWGAKEIIVWSNAAATYADANGDGIVDEKDLIGVGVNWSNTHTKNINSYEINIENLELLISHHNDFKKIYASLNGQSTEILEMKILLNNIFNFEDQIPFSLRLDQNFPNPFNPLTNIRFVLPKKQEISFLVTNNLGQLVSQPINNKIYDKGIHTVQFDGKDLPNGIYYYTIKSEQYNQTRKMIILK